MALAFRAGKPAAPQFIVPAGEYKLRVIEAEEDTSKQGNDMISLKLRVVQPDGSDGPALYDRLVLMESCFWKVDAFLKSADMHPGDGVEVNLDCDEMIGWEVTAKLGVSEYKGRKRNEVESYLFEEF